MWPPYRERESECLRICTRYKSSGRTNLCNTHGSAYARLYLPQMNNTCHAHHLQHAIIVIWRTELIVLVGTPGIGTAAPAAINKLLNILAYFLCGLFPHLPQYI